MELTLTTLIENSRDDQGCLKFEHGLSLYIEVEDGERLKRAIRREELQPEPKYAEMCRRFLADEEDFSEENLKRAGIVRRFQNMELESCVNELKNCIQKLQ